MRDRLRRLFPGGGHAPTPTPRVVWTGDSTFGECPAWSRHTSELYWLDIDTGLLRSYSATTGSVKEWNVGTQSAGLTVTANGNSLIIGRGGLLRQFEMATGALTPVDDVPGMAADERVNDLALDAEGALWVATMHRSGRLPLGRLLRRSEAGEWTTVFRGVPIVNGPAFDRHGGVAYACDSSGRRVLRFSLPPIGHSAYPEPTTFRTFTESDGFPDGIAVDASGAVWVAHYGGSLVTRFTADGVVAQVITVPAVNVTSVAIGDDTLYITTARHIPARGTATGGALYAVPLPGESPSSAHHCG